jgi:histidine triad (HIT) family protein
MSTEDTIFHKIIRREIPSEIVHEDDLCIAIKDVSPVSPTHLLIIPKETLPKLADAEQKDKALLGHMLFVCKQLAEQEGISEDGFRVVINNGENASQTVFQLHMHLIGGRRFSWPPG